MNHTSSAGSVPGKAVRAMLRRIALGCLSLLIGAAVWLPSMHLLFRRDVEDTFRDDGVPPRARLLAERHLDLWSDPALRERELGQMRTRNAEWDFMGRTFLVGALANMALREPASREDCLQVMDGIVDETLRLEEEEGLYFFLMPYAKASPWRQDPPRSQFLDGEIALMMAFRRMVEEKERYKALLPWRVKLMVARMKESPVLSAESYPNECWTFCNTVALAAIRLADHLDGTDHSEFLRDWVETAKQKLVHQETGLLVSSYTLNGQHMDGPEGSSIWMAAHCLRIVDEQFARDQYARARRELGRSVLGFGYAREWPACWAGARDVDSGPVVPVLGASPGASGLAFLGAATFGDREFLSGLMTSLEFAGFPSRRGGGLRYCASNPVGDAVLLYAALQGPVWEKVE